MIRQVKEANKTFNKILVHLEHKAVPVSQVILL